jgi:hypothetical protein
MWVSEPPNQTNTTTVKQNIWVSCDNESDREYTKDRRHRATCEYQSLSISIISSFPTTPLATNYSSIICHCISSFPVKGEYRPSLKDFLSTRRSSSKVPAPTSTKAWSAIAFTDFHPQPLALAKRGAWAMPIFLGALAPSFPSWPKSQE